VELLGSERIEREEGEGSEKGDTPFKAERFRGSSQPKRARRANLICGACERELPDGAYREEQRGRRQSVRRCVECVAAGNRLELVLMKNGRSRSEEDECPICNLPLPLDRHQFIYKACCMEKVCNGCVLASVKRGMDDCPFCRTPWPEEGSEVLTMIQKRVDANDPVAIYFLGSQYERGLNSLET